jgi:hypothetical protein
MPFFHGKCDYRQPKQCCNKIIKFLLFIYPALNYSLFKKDIFMSTSVMETTDTNIHIMLPYNINLYQAFYEIQSFLEWHFHVHISQEKAQRCKLAQFSQHPA